MIGPKNKINYWFIGYGWINISLPGKLYHCFARIPGFDEKPA
jgi:hypothetical protein